MSTDKIAETAARFVAALDAEKALRKARGRCWCEHEAPEQDEEGMAPHLHPDGQPWQRGPCWKMTMIEPSNQYDDGGLERFGDNSPRGWCGPCTERQRVHGELRVATVARVGALASLRAAVRRAAKASGEVTP